MNLNQGIPCMPGYYSYVQYSLTFIIPMERTRIGHGGLVCSGQSGVSACSYTES